METRGELVMEPLLEEHFMGMEEQALLELRQITELQEATVKVIHSDNSTLSNTYLIPEVKKYIPT